MRRARQLNIEIMLDLILVLKSTCVCTGGSKGRDEDSRRRAQGFELFSPFRGVVGDERGEFNVGSVVGDLWGATGNGVNAADAGVGKQAGEDVRSL